MGILRQQAMSMIAPRHNNDNRSSPQHQSISGRGFLGTILEQYRGQQNPGMQYPPSTDDGLQQDYDTQRMSIDRDDSRAPSYSSPTGFNTLQQQDYAPQQQEPFGQRRGFSSFLGRDRSQSLYRRSGSNSPSSPDSLQPDTPTYVVVPTGKLRRRRGLMVAQPLSVGNDQVQTRDILERRPSLSRKSRDCSFQSRRQARRRRS